MLLLRRTGGLSPALYTRPAVSLPVFVGFAVATGPTDPTLPAHITGDKCIGAQQRNNSTASSPDTGAGWAAWVSSQTGVATYTGTSGSVSIAEQTAAGSGTVWGDWSQTTGRLMVWVLRNAILGKHNGAVVASGTSFTWSGLSIDPNSFVGCGLFCNTAQTTMTIATEAPDQLTADRNSTTVHLASDTDTAVLNSFTGDSEGTKPLDTATVSNHFVFSILGA